MVIETRAPPLTTADLLADPGYPGETAESLYTEKCRTGPQRLTAADLDRFWLVDFRNPEGFTPLGMAHLELAYCWASQLVADTVPLVSGGFDVRVIGPYCYSTDLSVSDTFSPLERRQLLTQHVSALPKSFRATWATEAKELSRALRRFTSLEYRSLECAELAATLQAARGYIKHAWERHFALMYPLLIIQSSFYKLCDALGISRGDAANLLKGEATTVTAMDTAISTLALKARAHRVPLPDGTSSARDGLQHLRDIGGDAADWVSDFERFLEEFGWRADTQGDPRSSAWCEDPSSPIGHVRAALRDTETVLPQERLARARQDRDKLEARILDSLSAREQPIFRAALSDVRQANFPWWNEDHNPLIDMAAFVPVRLVALEIGRRIGLDDRGDASYLFCGELASLINGVTHASGVQSLVAERKDYHADWIARRQRLPRFIGPMPTAVDDPIFTEIEGLTPAYLRSVASPATSELRGTSVCGGVVEGTARVLLRAESLSELLDGEILVCEGITSAWAPIFARIRACLADQGGALSHTAIVAREHGLPCVVALGNATQVIRTGDRLRVDATNGTVDILQP